MKEWHVELSCSYREPKKYLGDSPEFKRRLEARLDLEEELRSYLWSEKKISSRILGMANYDNIHGVQGGICFGYQDRNKAWQGYQTLIRSKYLQQLAQKYIEQEIEITKPWQEWSHSVEITSFQTNGLTKEIELLYTPVSD